MNLIDLVVLVLIGLFALVGLKRGLVKSLVRLIGGVLAVVLAFLLTQSAVTLLSELIVIDGAPLSAVLADMFEEKIAGSFVSPEGIESFFTVVPAGGYTEQNISEALTINGVPALLSGFVAPILLEMVQGSSIALATYVAVALSNVLMTAIAFILLFIIISVLLGLITKLLDKVFNLPVIGLVNRLCGFIFGAIKAVLIVWVVLFLASLLGVVSGPIQGLIDDTVVVKFLSEHNLITTLISSGLDLETAIQDLLAGLPAAQ